MKKVVVGSLFFLSTLLLAGFGLNLFAEKQVEAAMAEFSVKNMTCGSCVSKIKTALGDLDGIQQVDIAVTTGRSQVVYDPSSVDPDRIAETISSSGFPASVLLSLSSDEYLAMKTEEGRLSDKYIARVGTRLISRTDFEARLSKALESMSFDKNPAAIQQVRLNLWQDIQQREILLASAESNQVVVHPGEVELRINKLRKSTPDFDNSVLASYDNFEHFESRLTEDMIIRRNIETNVIAGIENPQEQRQKLNQWYQNLTKQTPVVIFDADLKQGASGTGSGCGGSCC